MALVSVKNVPSYDEDLVYSAVCAHFDALGIAADIKPGMKILIKPNLLSARRPELSVTTHPSLLVAVVRWLRDHSAENIVIADSSGGLYNEEYMRNVYSASGLKRPELEPYLNHDFSFKPVSSREGFSVRSFNLITPVTEADYIINIAKLKTHAMTTMSAGVKNLFGTIPGLQKPDMHCRFPELPDFARMLCELCCTVAPDVTLLDAVDSMEGNGPNSGTVRHTGLTMASRDPFSLDTAAARYMGLDPETTPHLIEAKKLGLYPESVTFAGDDFTPCAVPFTMPDSIKSPSFSDSVPAFLRAPAMKLLNALARSFPKVDRAKCIGCGKCAESCPQHIITIAGKKASMPKKGCISCFCCQEMCPVHAISTSRRLKNL